MNPAHRAAHLWNLLLFGAVAAVSLFVATPFLFIDYATALANLAGEARTTHLGATGAGPIANAAWYVRHPMRDAVGDLGLILCVAGTAIAAWHSRTFRTIVLPFEIIFVVAICVQALVWPRWLIPLLPLLSVTMAVAVLAVFRATLRSVGQRGAVLAGAALSLAVVAPSIGRYQAHVTERANDTRMMASQWARRHIPPGSRVLIEQLALDLMHQKWRFLMPIGDAGCIDPVAELKNKIPYSKIDKWRGQRAILDLGTIDPTMLASCRADFAMLVDYDRYLAEPRAYEREIGIYNIVLAGGETVALFKPVEGQSGGPIVRVVKLRT